MPKKYKNLYTINEKNVAITINTKYGNFTTYIDHEDLERSKAINWNVSGLPRKNFYIRGSIPGGFTISLHRLIMSFPQDSVIDHKDGNTLNNCKENLRACSVVDNNLNRKTNNNFKGTRKKGLKWEAFCTINNKYNHIGTFETIELAANAYNIYCKKIRNNDFFIQNQA